MIVETVQIVATAATPVLIAFIGLKGKIRFDKITRKLTDLEITNKFEHKEITDSVEYINSRNELTKALTKVCNSSISYTQGDHELNTFKTTFTNSVIELSMSTLTSGFKFLNTDIFHGYMDVAGNKIIIGYKDLPGDFVLFMKARVREASLAYFDSITDLINDDVFNDKHDRFVDATIAYLRAELMIITKHFWTYNNETKTAV